MKFVITILCSVIVLCILGSCTTSPATASATGTTVEEHLKMAQEGNWNIEILAWGGDDGLGLPAHYYENAKERYSFKVKGDFLELRNSVDGRIFQSNYYQLSKLYAISLKFPYEGGELGAERKGLLQFYFIL